MIETLVPLKLPPGLQNNGTTYQSKGRWRDGNCVRFFQENIQPIGGWVARSISGGSMAGTPNAAVSWTTGGSTFGSSVLNCLAIGTTTGLYVIVNNQLYNITPTDATWLGNSGVTKFWQLDVYGSYLVATYNRAAYGGGANLYVWTGDLTTVATFVNTDQTLFPSSVFGLVVTPERFLVALRGQQAGSDPSITPAYGISGPLFPAYASRRIYWASQETIGTWITTALNTAGDFDLQTDGVPVCGKAARGHTLIWTTTDLWTMTYIGGDLLYSFARVGNNCGIIGQHAFVVLDAGAFWMGVNKFYHYDGFVSPLLCEVQDAVFGNFNTAQSAKVWAFANPAFSEITWHYPSAVSTECDRYVTYNYVEHHWTYGTIARTCGVTLQAGSATGCPVLIDASGTIYDHETGNARTGQTVFLESGPMEIGDGDQVMRLQRVVPDDKTQGDVNLYLYTSMFPDAAETLNGPYSEAAPTNVRLAARQVRLRIVEVAASAWRVGMIRLGAIAGGRR